MCEFLTCLRMEWTLGRKTRKVFGVPSWMLARRRGEEENEADRSIRQTSTQDGVVVSLLLFFRTKFVGEQEATMARSHAFPEVEVACIHSQ